jgi:hypothetical protein
MTSNIGEFDLSTYVELTDLGNEWANRILLKDRGEIDAARALYHVMPTLLSQWEQAHLVNLAKSNNKKYTGGYSMRTELRRLSDIGLIRRLPGRTIGEMTSNIGEFDLSTYVELTDLGNEWANRILLTT